MLFVGCASACRPPQCVARGAPSIHCIVEPRPCPFLASGMTSISLVLPPATWQRCITDWSVLTGRSRRSLSARFLGPCFTSVAWQGDCDVCRPVSQSTHERFEMKRLGPGPVHMLLLASRSRHTSRVGGVAEMTSGCQGNRCQRAHELPGSSWARSCSPCFPGIKRCVATAQGRICPTAAVDAVALIYSRFIGSWLSTRHCLNTAHTLSPDRASPH